ncbi:hypothetical protein PIB30_072984 [Stylosanthes scabra]|uniref:Secreted protein n=1 Tax=Stylosanthes scabra TaxID=79078 RepID=A0ABU6VSL6_9FABA|nr:hypothetical protein [Stylosanthes scabra]
MSLFWCHVIVLVSCPRPRRAIARLVWGPILLSFGPRAVTRAEARGRTPVNANWAENNSSHRELARYVQRCATARWCERATRKGFWDRASACPRQRPPYVKLEARAAARSGCAASWGSEERKRELKKKWKKFKEEQKEEEQAKHLEEF